MKPTSESDAPDNRLAFTDVYNEVTNRQAKVLIKNIAVRASYGFVDGFNLAYSTLKYFFDLIHAEDGQLIASDDLHDFMTTPFGAIITLITTSLLIVTSLIANVFSKDQKHSQVQRVIATYFPYVRDALKTTKNALKGVRSSMLALGILLKNNYKMYIFPWSLILGIPSLFNRLAIRFMDGQRDDKIRTSKDLLKKIRSWGSVHRLTSRPKLTDSKHWNTFLYIEHGDTRELLYVKKEGLAEASFEVIELDDQHVGLISERFTREGTETLSLGMLELSEYISAEQIKIRVNSFIAHIQHHCEPLSLETRLKQFLSKGYNGFIDGLYLFMGAITVTTFSPHMFLVVAILSSMFMIGNIVNRTYEEKNAQDELTLSYQQLHHAKALLEVEAAVLARLSCQLKSEEGPHTDAIDHKIRDFLRVRRDLIGQYDVSRLKAFFMGLQRGLFAYSALTSFMFCVAFIYFVSGFAIPVALVFGCVLLGTLILVGFITSSMLYAPKNNLSSVSHTDDAIQGAIVDDINKIKSVLGEGKHTIDAELKRTVKRRFQEGMVLDPAPQFFFQETFETLRSIFASFSKGQKEIEFLLNAYQDVDEQGHYHDSSFMIKLMVPVGALLAATFGVRTFAKEFSRKDVKPILKSDNKKQQSSSTSVVLDFLHPSMSEGTEDKKRPEPKIKVQKEGWGFFSAHPSTPDLPRGETPAPSAHPSTPEFPRGETPAPFDTLFASGT